MLIVLVAATTALAAWRRLSLDVAWPLVLSLLLWLPFMPWGVPAAFLLFQGPAVWFVWAMVAGGLVFVLRPFRAALWTSPAMAPWMAAGLVLVTSLLAFRSVPDVIPGGDEPHYLAATQSLLTDADLKVENNYARGDYLQYFPGRLEPHFLKRSTSGEIYSIHAPGLSVIVLPAFAVAGYGGAVFVMMLCAALTAAIAWRLAWRISGAIGAWAGVLGTVLTAPYFFHTFTIYPEVIGSLCVMGAVWLLMELDEGRAVTTRTLLIVGVLLATLPWLHSRFAVLSALLGAFIVARLLKGPDPLKHAGAFLVVPVLAAAGWFAFFWAIWGSPSPTSPYGADTSTSAAYIARGVVGLLLDQQFGILVTAPVYLVAAGGLVALARRQPRLAIELSVLTLAYAAAVASYAMWWAGSAAPARFLVAILPLAALPIALVGERVLTWVMLTVSVALVWPRVFVESGRFIYNGRGPFDATLEWLSTSADWTTALPSVHRDGGMTAVRDALAWVVVIAVMALAASRIGGRARGPRWTASAGCLAIAMLIASSMVWRLHGVNPLRIDRSKLAGLGTYRPERHTTLVDLSTMRSVSKPAFLQSLAVSIDGPRARINRVPAGDYDVTLAPGPGASAVAFSVGRDDPPFDTLQLDPSTPVRMRLPVPLLTLNISAKGVAADQRPSLRFTPVSVRDGAIDRYATHAVRYGRSRAFFYDEHAYPERDGFWTRAESQAVVLLDTDDAVRSSGLSISITAGAVATTVTLSSGAMRESVSLAAGQTQDLTLPPASSAAWLLRLRSTAGFRPSERDPASRDVRLLGAWIAVH